MAEFSRVKIANLLLDENNPRLSTAPQEAPWSQRTILEYFAADAKVFGLAKDIAAKGLNPSKRPIIVGQAGSSRHIVLEGNRRLAALKLLLNPSLAVSPSFVRKYQVLAESSHGLPTQVDCVILESRKKADHWIRIEHGLGKNGTSTLEWGAGEKSRYQQRFDGGGRYAKSTALVDSLVEIGAIGPTVAREVPITTLDRVLSDPDVRGLLVLDFDDLDLNERNLPAIATVVADLASGAVKVDDVRKKSQRVTYVKAVLASPRDVVVGGTKAKRAARSSTPRPHHKRKHLIPADFRPKLKQKRLSEIYDELRHISVERYPNAVGVLLRSFVEIAIWDFFEERGFQHSGSLAANVRKSAKLLAKEGLITAGMESVVVRATDDEESFLSVKALHQFVHGPFDLPSPTQLNRIWTGLQPFLEAVVRAE